MLSLKLPKELENRLNHFATVTHRPKSYYMRVAIEQYLQEHEWQVQEIVSACEAADLPSAKFVDHEDVSTWLKSWGTDHEAEPPTCG